MLISKTLRSEYPCMLIVLFDRALHAKDTRNKSFKQLGEDKPKDRNLS